MLSKRIRIWRNVYRHTLLISTIPCAFQIKNILDYKEITMLAHTNIVEYFFLE